MSLAKYVTTTETVPGEDATITFRMLTWMEQREAEQARTRASIAAVREMGDLGDRLRSASTEEIEAARKRNAEAERDPLNDYDQAVLLQHGITAWSYQEAVDHSQLDAKTAEWAARRILHLCGFESPEERKNG